MSEKPEALRLADWHESVRLVGVEEQCWKAAAELRRLHAENERLREALEKIADSSMSMHHSAAHMAVRLQTMAREALRREDV